MTVPQIRVNVPVKMMNVIPGLLLGALALGVAACSGGSGSVTTPSPSPFVNVNIVGTWKGLYTLTSLSPGSDCSNAAAIVQSYKQPVMHTWVIKTTSDGLLNVDVTDANGLKTATYYAAPGPYLANYLGMQWLRSSPLSPVACSPSVLRDLRSDSGFIEVTSITNTRLTGTATENFTVKILGQQTEVNALVFNSSFAMTRQ